MTEFSEYRKQFQFKKFWLQQTEAEQDISDRQDMREQYCATIFFF